MKQLRAYLTAMLLTATLAFVPATSAAQSHMKVDLTGTWSFSVTTDAGTGAPTVTLKQQGDSLAGHYSSPTLGENELKGLVKDRTFTFAFRTEVQGTALEVTYTGMVGANDALKGTVDLGAVGSGTFTAKRQ